jgi:nucleotide-binding universal stress UspA family protein
VGAVDLTLVALADGRALPTTARAARAVADLLGTGLRGVHVPENGGLEHGQLAAASFPVDVLPPGPVIPTLRAALARPDVVLGVVGAGRATTIHRPGHVAEALVRTVPVPLLVVPPTSRLGPELPVRRVLVPLDGRPETSRQVERALTLLRTRGPDVIAAHVLDPTHEPAQFDTEPHGLEAWRREFRARYAGTARLELRRGPPWAAVSGCLADVEADLLVLAWSQRLLPGRARLVRAALAEADVPVLLVPPLPKPAPVR